MTPTPHPVAREAAGMFAISGELQSIEPFERGHIHDSYISTWVHDSKSVRFLHQHLNQHVFRDIPALMHNVQLVTEHLHRKLEGRSKGLDALKLVTTKGGKIYYQGPSGCWRTYHYIEQSESFDRCDHPERAYEAANAFGSFLFDLADIPTDQIRVTIPSFFSTPHRFEQFEEALKRDEVDRVSSAEREIRFVLDRRATSNAMEGLVREGRIPQRIVHGDTKLNNVLFDQTQGNAISVVDLDTCMLAWSVYDFGDLVRFTAATSAEDETDLSLVGMDLDLYRALVTGYLDGAGALLTEEEIRWMPFAARLVTFTVGIRFLADHLAGDEYFKVNRPTHNLDRARVQFKMVEAMERREAEMIVRRFF